MINKANLKFLAQFAIDDFKTKYAGSLLGLLWAFVQPIINVIIYWFVFQVAFRSEPINNIPFIVWLVSGLVPWFFVSDAITNSTASLVDYSYLVKKVVFNIDILPLTRVLSNVFIQCVLVIFAIVLSVVYGCWPSVHIIQLLYYLSYAIVVCTGIAYLTSALYIFFKDIIQLVAVIIQVVFWCTPIVWRIDVMSETIQKILVYNPLYYITNGYRDSMINSKWFFEYKLSDTVYYWVIAFVILWLGITVFRKLKPHFADVL